MSQHRPPRGQLRVRTGLSPLSSPSLEGQWNPDPFEFAPGDISPTSDPGRILRPLTLGLIWKPAHWPFYQLKLLAHSLVISLRSECLGCILRLSRRSKGQRHLTERTGWRMSLALTADDPLNLHSQSLCVQGPCVLRLWTSNAAWHNRKGTDIRAVCPGRELVTWDTLLIPSELKPQMIFTSQGCHRHAIYAKGLKQS